LGGVGFLTTLGVGVGYFSPTPEVRLNNFLCLLIIEMVQFLFKLLLKQIFLVAYHDFHLVLVATKLLTAKFHSLYVEESVSNILPPTPQAGNDENNAVLISNNQCSIVVAVTNV